MSENLKLDMTVDEAQQAEVKALREEIESKDWVIKAYERDIEKFSLECTKAGIEEHSPEAAVAILAYHIADLESQLAELRQGGEVVANVDTVALARLADRIEEACGSPIFIDHTASAAIRAILTRQPAIPPGYVVVPVEPTQEMMASGEEAFCATANPGATWAEHTGSIYRAMLAQAEDMLPIMPMFSADSKEGDE